MNQTSSWLSLKTKTNLMLKAFGLAKVPLLFATGCSISEIDDTRCTLSMPFRRHVKNHLGSLYFGALAIGADGVIGVLAAHKIQQRNERVGLVFKSFEARFLKRAIGPTDFICDRGEEIDKLIDEALQTGERVHRKIAARAQTNGEIVAEFVLELSLKKK